MNKQSIVCVTSVHDQALTKQLQKDLTLANITLTQENVRHKKSMQIDLVWEGSSEQDYYSFVCDLIKNVINKPEIANIVQDFQKEYESLILSAQREEKFMRAGKKSFHSILLPAFLPYCVLQLSMRFMVIFTSWQVIVCSQT